MGVPCLAPSTLSVANWAQACLAPKPDLNALSTSCQPLVPAFAPTVSSVPGDFLQLSMGMEQTPRRAE